MYMYKKCIYKKCIPVQQKAENKYAFLKFAISTSK